MGKQRKYLDRGRRIRLDGRSIAPDWIDLLMMGRRAVLDGRADTVRHLDDVMREGMNEIFIRPRPAAFDYPLLREWLHVDESAATDFLRAQWRMARAPEDSAEALSMMDSADCIASGLGSHRLTAEMFEFSGDGDDGIWLVGPCRDCLRALLWHFPNAGTVPRTWQFYDHEAEYIGTELR